MIIFLGDSFTWGQGLYYKKWLESGKTIEFCEKNLPPKFSHENISYIDDEYRREKHFPNLVSKHFNRSYYSKPGNGGNNRDLYHIANEISKYAPSDAIDLVVVEFTEFLRDLNYKIPPEIGETLFDDWVYDNCKKQIHRVFDSLSRNAVKNIVMFSWREDIGKILHNEYKDFIVPLIYNDIEYQSFDKMLEENQELVIAGDLNISDGHFSERGHEVIAKCIIDKVNSLNISFTEPTISLV